MEKEKKKVLGRFVLDREDIDDIIKVAGTIAVLMWTTWKSMQRRRKKNGNDEVQM